MALPDTLGSLDEKGHRKTIIPGEVRGPYRRARTIVQAVLLVVFLILPWLKVNGDPVIFLDVSHRRFTLMGFTFFSHDAPMIFFILLFLLVGLAFITSVWGRVWCGWACPQTVFIDGVFRRIEYWVEGSYLKRRKLYSAPWGFEKISKKAIKWSLFFIVASLVSHSFIAYFVGADQLMEMVQHNPAQNSDYFLLISAMTLLVLFDFAWFREQFCIIMCPYGRIQSVLMDHSSLAVIYDSKRGEPRKGKDRSAQGDCVACNRCVQVCPTGIDIRDGVQMECITCTACIDACDEIMEKVHKPKHLIQYYSPLKRWQRLKKPRAFVYMSILLFCVVGLSIALGRRTDLDAAILRAKDTPYSEVTDESGNKKLMNHLRVHLQNQTLRRMVVTLKVATNISDNAKLITPQNPLELQPGERKEVHFFVEFDKSVLQRQGERKTNIVFDYGDERLEKNVTLLGPLRSN